ncbi:hypothetical protein C8R44DRAFT_737492 [Mycena epipterygia]|nr:hypothetical protein C8R44DRAFT_737492 [Mycena epipterygia]
MLTLFGEDNCRGGWEEEKGVVSNSATRSHVRDASVAVQPMGTAKAKGSDGAYRTADMMQIQSDRVETSTIYMLAKTPSEFLGGIGSGPLNLGDKVYIKDFPSYKKVKIIEKELKNSFGQNIEACVENNFVSESPDAEAGSGQKLGAERVTITAPYMTTIPDFFPEFQDGGTIHVPLM